MVDCSGFIKPLNLECLFVNIFVGSIELFMVLSFIFIAGLAAYFRMVGIGFLMLYIVFAILFGIYLPGLYLFVVLFVALFVGYWIAKAPKN